MGFSFMLKGIAFSWLGLIFATSLIGGVPSVVYAQSAACVTLKKELVSLSRQRTSSRNLKRYNKYNAIAGRQRAELKRALSAQRQTGCTSLIIFRRSHSPQCNRLKKSIGKMKANIAKLEAKRDRYGGRRPTNVSARKARIQRDMKRRRCFSSTFQAKVIQNKKRSVHQSSKNAKVAHKAKQGDALSSATRGKKFRTLCVRTCDGYYWPISFSTTRGKFQSDEAACQAMCPASPVALYVHRNPGSDTENMTSLRTNKPYVELANAFKYRQTYDKSCSCGKRVLALAETSSRPNQEALSALRAIELRSTLALPIPRIAPTEDPDTSLNLAGDYNPSRPPVDDALDSRKIRIVGPAHFYVQ